MGGSALHRQRLARTDARRAADHVRPRRSDLGRPDLGGPGRCPVRRLVRGLPQPLPEGVSMSLPSPRRPLSSLTVALLVRVPLLAAPTPTGLRARRKAAKTAARREGDQELAAQRLK